MVKTHPAFLLALLFSAPLTHAQPTADHPPALQGWQQCQSLTSNNEARLACYDHWAQQQTSAPAPTPTPGTSSPPSPDTGETVADTNGCHDRQYSTLSRFWELEKSSDCGTFGLRGYRPLDIAFSIANGPPQTPTSPAPGHTGTPQDYQSGEMRLNLSLRTKLAKNLLTRTDPTRQDSLWFGYTQQSAWQLFNADLSRPFRNTDHEPELIYVYPVDLALGGGWRWRHAGLGLVHQSNGQSLPLSRSWNRVYAMGGFELDDRLRINARVWQRIPESASDDDNPDISQYIGRAEVAGWWSPDKLNTLGATVRFLGKGSVRLEWLHAIGDPAKSNLRLHAQLFHGYGDTLVDYNRLRTVFSVGLSLVDF